MRQPRMRPVPAVAVAVLLALPLLLPGAALAETAEGVPTLIEAWYRTSPIDTGGEESPVCQLPTGCPEAPAELPNQYPPMTLHVDQVGPTSTAQTFFSLDLGALSFDAEVTGGTVTLPVAGADAGTQAPETAQIVACLVSEPIAPAEGGSASEAPAYDCATSAPATFVPGPPPVFTVDLAPFVGALSSGTSQGLALVAAPDSAPANWHVALSAKGREAEGAAPITAAVQFTQPEPTSFGGGSFSPGVVSGNTVPPPSALGGFAFELPPAALPLPSSTLGLPASTAFQPQIAQPPAAPVQVAPPVAAAPVQQPVAAIGNLGYAYPAVWLLPLVLLGVGGALSRSLTAEMTLPALAGTGGGGGQATGAAGTPKPGAQAGPGLFTRLWSAARRPPV